MGTSRHLARLIGPVLVLAGISMLIDAEGYASFAQDFMRSPALIYLASFIGLVTGLAVILVHNIWTRDWRVLITLLAWATVLDSVTWLLARELVLAIWSPLLASEAWLPAGAAFAIALGGVLSFFGYRARSRLD